MTRPAANPKVLVTIIHRDPVFLVVDKAAGCVTEPGLGHARDALLNGVMAIEPTALGTLGAARDWGLLHRLDRDTSGCVLVALTAHAYDALRAQFEARSISKFYLTVVKGRPPRESGTLDTPLEETRRGDMKISVPGRRGAGRPAVTHWRTLGTRAGATLLLVEIETGRLHQIRAHLALLGCPVEGDRVYRADLPPNTSRPRPGREPPPLQLHAWKLAIDHPVHGTRVEFEAPPPARLAVERFGVDAATLGGSIRSRPSVSIEASARYAATPHEKQPRTERPRADGRPRDDRHRRM